MWGRDSGGAFPYALTSMRRWGSRLDEGEAMNRPMALPPMTGPKLPFDWPLPDAGQYSELTFAHVAWQQQLQPTSATLATLAEIDADMAAALAMYCSTGATMPPSLPEPGEPRDYSGTIWKTLDRHLLGFAAQTGVLAPAFADGRLGPDVHAAVQAAFVFDRYQRYWPAISLGLWPDERELNDRLRLQENHRRIVWAALGAIEAAARIVLSETVARLDGLIAAAKRTGSWDADMVATARHLVDDYELRFAEADPWADPTKVVTRIVEPRRNG